MTIDVPSTSTNDTSVGVFGSEGSDPESAVVAWSIERQRASLAGDVCATYGGWVQLGPSNPTSRVLDDLTAADATCSRYRFVSTSAGGSTVTEQVGELKVDRSPPVATIDTPTGPIRGSVLLTGSAADAITRVASVSVSVQDRYPICPSAPIVDGRWTCTWDIGELEVGPADVAVVATDSVGQRASASVHVTIVKPPSPFGPRPEDVDTTAPIVGLKRMPLVSWLNFVTVKASAFDDRPGVVEIGVEHQRIAAGAARFTPWRTSYEETTRVELPRRGETSCWRGIAVDTAGNRSVSDPRCTTLPLDDIDMTATGGWTTVRARAAYRGATRRSTRRGSALTVRLAGAAPTLVVTRCRICGSIRVFHGRRTLGTYSLRARGTSYRQLIRLPRLVRPSSAPIRVVTRSTEPVFIDGLIPGR